MDKQHFDQLIKGVREVKRHIAGKTIRGARTTELTEPDIRAIREATKISQTQFAKLISVNVRSLQNWEQIRTRTGTGTAEDCCVESESCDRGLARIMEYPLITVPRQKNIA
jgi:putative transcriptional regulator